MLADSSELGVAGTLLGWCPFLSLRGQMTRRIAGAPAHPLAATTLPPDSDALPWTSNTMTARPMMSPARSNSCILAASIFVSLLAEVARPRFRLVEDQPANLGTEHVLAAIVLGQRPAQAHLGQAGAVQWRRVEVADALLPGGIDGGGRLCFRDVAEHVAQRRGTEAQRAAD